MAVEETTISKIYYMAAELKLLNYNSFSITITITIYLYNFDNVFMLIPDNNMHNLLV